MSNSHWSFSRAKTYHTCPKAYKLLYLDNIDKKNNAFAQWGSLIHKCMEEYHKGNLDIFNMVDYYDEHYSEYVTERFPYNKYVNMNEKYYEDGIDYLSNFSDIYSANEYEVVGVEQEIMLKISGYNILGYIDLILRNKQDGSFVIVDHKSAKEVAGDTLEEYTNQMFLYATYIKEKYKTFPTKLTLNLIKGGKLVEISFDEEQYNKAIEWLVNTIKAAESDNVYTDIIELAGDDTKLVRAKSWYCNNLCSACTQCDKSYWYEGGDKDWL